MKKLSTILVLIILLSKFLFSQNMEIKWQQCFGGSEMDYATDIIAFGNNYYIAGGSVSNDGDISFNHGEGDGWVIYTDNEGSMLWEKTFGGSNGEYWMRIIPTSNNNFYLLGSSYSSNGDITNDPYPESTDYWIVKIDSSGNIIWDKIVGGNGGDWVWTGTATNDGGIVALGYSGSEYGDVSINYGLYDMWMIKLNSEGEIEWDFTLGTDWQDYGQAIIQTSDGGFLVGGSSKLTGGGNLNCECNGQADGVLVKLDSLRNIEWQQCYGGSDYDGVTGLLEIDDGYIFTAYNGSNDGDISGWHGADDIWSVKIDFAGNIVWQNSLGGSRYEFADNIFQLINEEIIVVGITESHDGDVSGNHSLSEYDNDIWIVKLSGEGELLSQQCFGGQGDERINFGVVKKSDNNYVIAGQTDYGPSYDVACTPHGGNGVDRDFWVFEIDMDDTTDIFDIPAMKDNVKVYPNPAGDYVVFEFEESIDKNKISIFNTFGEEVTQMFIKQKKTVWDTREVQNGIYFYKAEIEKKFYSGKIVIQK